MKNKVAISKINIKIGDKEIPLTLEEAQELRQILDETFGKKETVIYPYQPIVIERPIYRHWDWWNPPYVTTAGGVSSMTFSLTSGNTADPDLMPVS